MPLAIAAASAGSVVRTGGVTASVTGTTASLTNHQVTRTWQIAVGGPVQTTSLAGPGHRQWAAPGPDFAIDIDGVPTSSTSGWVLQSVEPRAPRALPDRPGSGRGAALLFRYSLGSPALAPVGLELDRLVELHPGSAVIETTTTLIDHGPLPARVASYTLDQIVAKDRAMPAEVHAYNGGSDWRDDYRHISNPAGAFDAEGEVARFGSNAGFFLVSQRRGGAMSRTGRDATGRSWIGVDWARDLFDWGPLQTSPPSYNRLENPVYPVPVRARLLPPLGTLDLGTSFVGVYDGGPQEAAAAFAKDFVGAAEPSFARSVSLNTFHPWSHGPGMSDANLRHQVDAAAALGVETFMLDDQWQGGPNGESGDWRFDASRFPDANHDGKPDFVDYVHSKGLQLGLWMSPIEFNMASTTYAAHPDWACFPVGDVTAQVQDDAGLGVWDATNPAFQSYLIGVVDRLVRDYDVHEFKFDFMAWVDCLPHDYADYEDAFVSMVHRMQALHPNVTFELDETNDQRSWPFESAQIGPSWFDNGHTHGSTQVAKLLHDVWSAAPWVPTWTLGIGTYDGTLTGPYAGVNGVDFMFPLAMLTHVTFWTDLTTLTPAQQAETAWWIRWYSAHRNALGPAVYELTTTDPIDGSSWAAWQPWNGTSGYVFAFRQSGLPGRQLLRLYGVQSNFRYVVTDVRTGTRYGTFAGAQLTAGLPISLDPNSAVVLSVRPAP
jgi:Melibiase